jgi:hypothetical protein
MKTIEQILELIKLNAYSGTPENIQAIVELVNEAQTPKEPQTEALHIADASCCAGLEKNKLTIQRK